MDLRKNSSTFCVKDYEGILMASGKILAGKNDAERFIYFLKNRKNDLSLAILIS